MRKVIDLNRASICSSDDYAARVGKEFLVIASLRARVSIEVEGDLIDSEAGAGSCVRAYAPKGFQNDRNEEASVCSARKHSSVIA